MTVVQDGCVSPFRQRWMSWLEDGFGWRRARAGKPHLDVRELPRHLQRDLGILDGNDPAGRRP